MVYRTVRALLAAFSTVTLLVTATMVTSVASASAAPGSWRYTMVAFSNVSDRDLDVYESTDGTNFAPAALSAYRPPTGLVRDPSIFRHTDGAYYLVYTTGSTGATIGFARSTDRVTWTPLGDHALPFCCALLPGTGDGTGSANIPGFAGSSGLERLPSLSPFTTKAWAPEWFVDGGTVHVIVSLSTGGGFVPYVITATDPSLQRWTAPVPMVGLGADRIDTTVVKVGPVYHAFTKNETRKTIEHATAPTLFGPYAFVPPGDWGPTREGPAVVELPNGVWRLYLDAYTEGKYLFSDSADGLQTWSAVQELPAVSGSIRHIGVMREPVS